MSMLLHANPASTESDSAALLPELRPALIAYFRRRCGNAAEAEDLAQDVIVRALAHAGWTSVDEARSYIFTIAVNRWRDRERRKVTHGSEVDWNDGAVAEVSEEIPLERVVSAEAELRAILAALQELGERTRQVLVLCRFEQMKQVEIARILGISVSAVEKHLVKALAHLGRRINHEAN